MPRELGHVRIATTSPATAATLASAHQTVACCRAYAILDDHRQLMSRPCRQLQTMSSYSMNVRRPLVTAACVLAMLVSIAGCSDRTPAGTSIPAIDAGEALQIKAPAGGIPTDMTAYFDGEHLHRIVETRTAQPGSMRHGDYRFTQARLTEYTGDALGGEGQVQLAFDLHGVVTKVTPELSPAEIASIRTRAELLRSLALARHSTQQHQSSH